jgi:hypothetical protein
VCAREVVEETFFFVPLALLSIFFLYQTSTTANCVGVREKKKKDGEQW